MIFVVSIAFVTLIFDDLGGDWRFRLAADHEQGPVQHLAKAQSIPVQEY